MSAKEYEFACFGRFKYLPQVIFFRNTNPEIQKFVAESIIDIWQKLQRKESLINDPDMYRLCIACESMDPRGVAEYCVARRRKLVTHHYLFGYIPVAKSLQWWNIRKLWLLGILVYRQRIE